MFKFKCKSFSVHTQKEKNVINTMKFNLGHVHAIQRTLKYAKCLQTDYGTSSI